MNTKPRESHDLEKENIFNNVKETGQPHAKEWNKKLAHICTKTNSKSIKDLVVRQITKHTGENIDKTFYAMNLGVSLRSRVLQQWNKNKNKTNGTAHQTWMFLLSDRNCH